MKYKTKKYKIYHHDFRKQTELLHFLLNSALFCITIYNIIITERHITMESNKFKALKAAVELGSLTNAASELGYTQAGLTHMMNRLENEIGCTLLFRDKYGVHLTHDGERLMPYIEDYLRAGDRLEKEIAMTKEDEVRTLRIAAYTSMINSWLPLIMSRFKQTHPSVSFEIIDDSIMNIYNLVYEGKVDLGFVSKQDDIECDFIHLRNDPLLAVLPPDSDIAQGLEKIPVEEFSGVQFIMPSRGFDMDIMRALEKSEVRPTITNTNVDDAAIVSMVAHGLGATVLSALVLKNNIERVRIMPLDPESYRDLGIISMPGVSQLAREFIEVSKNEIKPD